MTDLDTRLREGLADAADAVEPVATTDLAAALAARGPRRSGPARLRPLLAVAAVLAVVAVVGAVVATRGDDPGDTRVHTPPPPTAGPTVTGDPEVSTSTTLPAIGTTRSNAVTAWTGTEYLVWGGQAGSDGYGRADGWAYDPVTGDDRPIPVAPMPPLDQAFGAWNGSELVVVGGLVPLGSGSVERTGRAAAYDPAVDRWRQLADLPSGAGDVVGVTAVGDDLYVVTDGPALFELGPAGDAWLRRSPPTGVSVPYYPVDQVVAGDDVLVLWRTGDWGGQPGARYDPATDTWTDLLPVPVEGRMEFSSATVAGRWLVAWGSSAADDTRTTGVRLDLDDPDATWQVVADAPLGPIDWGEGTSGSQTLAADPVASTVWVVPVNGGESYDPDRLANVTGVLTYAPATDTWSTVPEVELVGWAPALTIGRTTSAIVLLLPDVEEPARFVPLR